MALQARQKSWWIYAWSLVRPNGGSAALALGAQYGGSQAGLIVRHALGDGGQASALYACAATALARADDRTLALGITARPWGNIPLELAVERRFGLFEGQKARFAAMLVSGGATRLGRSQIKVKAFAQAGVVGLNTRRGFSMGRWCPRGRLRRAIGILYRWAAGSGPVASRNRIPMVRCVGSTGSIWGRAQRWRCHSGTAR
ncbi:hypothetical protein [Blastomonas sp.]|uniref:hypothetical protein n=1 Tax=Blastomonas sp. TaxID=1909299 RepID=UPI00262CADED|nr:hypothetical protein [Blastomonas sp.]MDM7955956.1 hypothetical protein [Blastomonas sp.]